MSSLISCRTYLFKRAKYLSSTPYLEFTWNELIYNYIEFENTVKTRLNKARAHSVLLVIKDIREHYLFFQNCHVYDIIDSSHANKVIVRIRTNLLQLPHTNETKFALQLDVDDIFNDISLKASPDIILCNVIKAYGKSIAIGAYIGTVLTIFGKIAQKNLF